MDMQTYKKRNNLDPSDKIFIIKGGYSDLRDALEERGWVENEDVYSNCFDFKWTTKMSDIDFANL